MSVASSRSVIMRAIEDHTAASVASRPSFMAKRAQFLVVGRLLRAFIAKSFAQKRFHSYMRTDPVSLSVWSGIETEKGLYPSATHSRSDPPNNLATCSRKNHRFQEITFARKARVGALRRNQFA